MPPSPALTPPPPNNTQHHPHQHIKRTYGQKVQYAKDGDDSPLLSKSNKKIVQEVIGVLLHYARAIDLTMLPTLKTLPMQQAAPIQNKMKNLHQFLDYVATHPDAIATYNSSDMVLTVHSDAPYLSKSNAQSRAGGHFFMSNNSANPPNNGVVLK